MTRTWAGIAVVLVIALGLRLHRLGHESFWIDEVASMHVAVQPLRDIVLNYRPGMHPSRGAEQAPLAFVVMHLFLSPDHSEASARLPSALLGATGVWLLFLFARRLFPAPIPLLSAAVLSLSPLHVWYSQDARWYAQWIVLTILSYWALLRAWETGRTRAWLAYWLCTVLSVYTFILSFLVMACQGISVLWIDRGRGTRPPLLPRFVLVQAAVGIAVAPVLWMIVKTLGLTTGTPRPKGLAELPYTFFIYAAGYSAGPTTESLHALPALRGILTEYPIVIVFAAVFAPLVVLGVRAAARKPFVAALLLPWCFGPPVLAYLISLCSNVTYQARYSSAALPAFVLLLALGIVALQGRGMRWGAGAAVCACFVVSLAHYYWDPDYAKEDIRSAVARIQAVGSGAPVAVVGQVDPAVAYYGPDLHVVPLNTCAADTSGHDPLAPALDEGKLWLIVSRDWEQQGPRCLDRLSRTHTAVERQRFPGVDLWLFTPRAGTDSSRENGNYHG